MTELLPLFAFGTLRRNEPNHHYLHRRYERCLLATLPGYAIVAPLMIAPAPGEEVTGELFFLTPGIYEATLAGCDELEEIPPGQLIGQDYERRRVVVATEAGHFEAWAYVQPEPQIRHCLP